MKHCQDSACFINYKVRWIEGVELIGKEDKGFIVSDSVKVGFKVREVKMEVGKAVGCEPVVKFGERYMKQQ